MTISNLYIEGLSDDLGPVELVISNSALPKTNFDHDMAIEVIKFTEPYVEFSWMPENQYAYDNEEDIIKIDLLYEDEITTFHDNDYLVVKLPESSGAKWLKEEYIQSVTIDDNYIIFNDLSLFESLGGDKITAGKRKLNLKEIIKGIFTKI